jgi:inner membrane protein
MTPGAHFLASWICATGLPLERRERRLVTLAGVSPDLDGLGVAADLITRGRTDWYGTWHHLLCHNLAFAILFSVLAGAMVKGHRLRTITLAFLMVHGHFLLDLIGSKGRDGDLWPIPYLVPFSRTFELSWRGAWYLDSWQNLVFLTGCFVIALALAVRQRRSFIEVVSYRLDRELFLAVSRRWPG